jgi:hypothetical protein
MPMRYQRNDARRRMVVTVQSTIDPDDTPAMSSGNRLDDGWSYGSPPNRMSERPLDRQEGHRDRGAL